MADQVVNVTVKGIGDFSDVAGKVKDLQGVFNGLKLNPNLASSFTKEFNNLQKLLNDYNKLAGKEVTSKKDIKNMENLEKAINSSFSTLNKLYSELGKQTILTNVDSSKLDELRSKTQAAQKELQNVFTNINVGSSTGGLKEIENSIEKAVGRSKTLKNSFSEVFSSLSKSGDVQQFTSGLDSIFENLNSKLRAGKLQPTIDSLLNSFKSLGLIKIDMPLDSTAQKLLALKTGFDTLKTAIANGVSGDELKVLIQNLETATKAEKDFQAEAEKRGKESFDKQASGAKKLADATREGAAEMQNFKQQSLSATTQLEQLQSSTQYFFGLRNMINLLKRGLREAIETIKELDAAMTETAVVTKFDVGDMWAKLPEYTANANALGATVQDMYKSTTLYYQQGLNAEQAMSIASETMKMARIGGLEAAEATDMMTAALRGFNMELNETSAQRINDVYSNLAAKTASNTEELGNAMQRTASIAANAGMSFEGTAAFLAQAIETTREPAENIGTAMKTIIARMQEMKKNPLEISEVDGEEVDYNKIDAALKSIGISIKKANGDFRDNDEVLLDISKRWDSLSQTQQRYIATTIAGSRQQSRFIAMVGDYERTRELMSYANDSEGASDAQFGKTLDSLEAKLNKFQNAWKAFLMNIMNDSWTKTIVSGATTVLNVVNSLINTLSFGSKGIKSALTLFTAFNALKIAGRGANMFIGGLGGMMSPGSSFKEGFLGGATGLAGKGTNRIIQAINNLIPHIDKAAMSDQYKYTGYGDYKNARQQLRQQMSPIKSTISGETNVLAKGGLYSVGGINALFDKNQLNKEQQKALLNSFPGLKAGMARNLANIMRECGASPQVAKGLIAGFKKGEITSEQVLQKSGMLTNYTSALKSRVEEGGEEAARAFARAQYKTFDKEEIRALGAQGKAEGKTGADLTKYVKQQLDKKLQERGNVYAKNTQVEGMLRALQEPTTTERFANAMNGIGSAITSAGMSLQMFGAQLAVTNPLLGETITQLGGLVMMLGSLPNTIAAIVAGGPVVIGLAVAVGALVAAFGKATFAAKKLKKAADEIQKKFENTNKETQQNIATLKQYQQQAQQWSKGVDANGYNVSLTDDEYNQYLTAIDEIAKMNSSVIKGYNAQGHAIMDINKALSETIKLEQQHQEEAFKTYLEPSTLDKLIKARNVDDNFQKATLSYQEDSWASSFLKGLIESLPLYNLIDGKFIDLNWDSAIGKFIDTKLDTNIFTKKVAPFTDDVKKLTENLQKDLKTTDLSQFLAPFQIDWGKLSDGDEKEIRKFVRRRNDIYAAALKESKGELSDDFTSAFTTLEENSEAFDESINATLQWLQTSVSQSKAFENLPSEIKDGVMQGLEDIAIQPDLTFENMQVQADYLVKEFDNLTRKGGEYATAMKEVEEAQKSFASSRDVDEYADKTKNALNTLDTILKQHANDTTAYGQAVREYLENQKEQIQKFTEVGNGVSLAEGFNEASGAITAAEGSYKAFQDTTKTDITTGVDNMRSIYEDITKETNGIALHMQERGDKTMWTGAEYLLGEEFVKENADNIEAIKSEIRSLKPELQEGEQGFQAFVQKFKQVDDTLIKGFTWNEDGSYDIDTNINPDAYKEIAEQMHRSEEYVVSMLNAGRQFAEINFTNEQAVREALSVDNAAITGTGSTNGQRDLYVKRDYLKSAMEEADIYNPIDQEELFTFLETQGIKEIPNASEMTKQDFKNMGISDLPSLVKTLGDTNNFDRSEIEAYAKQLEGDQYNPEVLDTTYQDYLDTKQHPELPSINNIDSNVATIASILASNRLAEGYADESVIAAYEEAKKNVYGADEEHDLGNPDSVSEYYAQGKNKDGQDLTDAERKQTKETLQKEIDTYKLMQERAEAGAKAAEAAGRETDAQELYKEAADYKKWAELIESDVELGDKYEKANEARKAREEEANQAALDYAPKAKENQKNRQEELEAGRVEAQQGREDAIKKSQSYNAYKLGLEAGLTEAQQGREDAINKSQSKNTKDASAARVNAEKSGESYQLKQSQEAQKEQAETLKKVWAEEESRYKAAQDSYKASHDSVEEYKKAREIEEKREPIVAQLSKEPREQAERKAQNRELYQSQNKQIHSQIDDILEKNINSSFNEAISHLNPTEISKDPAQTKALSNIYADVMEGRLPTIQDIQALKISDPLDADFLKQIDPDIFLGGGLNIKPTKDKLASFALDLVGLGDIVNNLDLSSLDTVDSAIDEVQNWLTSCYAHINGIEVPEMASTVNEGSGTVASIAQGAISATFGIEVEGGEQIEEATTQAEGAADIINQGAKFVIDVAGEKKLKTAADKADKLTKNQGTKNFGVTTSFDSKAVTTGIQAIKNITDTKIIVGANADPAYADARSVANKIRNITTTLSVYMRQAGNWSVYIGAHGPGAKEAYTGLNNKISYHHVPEAGSLAGGTKKGRVGPRNQGGMTLTGELGYEIAWLPEENRSVILGASGPQMVNLPKSAVVYNHDQSKEIMKKRKGIEAGSMGHGKLGDYPSSSTTGGRTNGGNNRGNEKTTQTPTKPETKIAKNTGVVLVWWENMARRVDAVQKKYEENARTLEKRLKMVGTTLNSIKGLTNDYRKNLNQSIALNTQEKQQAEKELRLLKQGNNWRSKQEISYTVKKIEDGDEKSETKKVDLDLAKFLMYNSQFKTWEISQAALNTISNKTEKEAVKQALEKEINDRNNKIKTAEDNIQRAQEALDKLSDDMYETFYRWEKSINKIYLLSQRLDTLGRQQTMQTNVAEIEYAKMSIGIQTAAEAQEKVNKALREQNELLAQEVHGRNQAIVEARQEFDSALNFKTYEDIYKANKNSPTAQGDFEAAKMAFNLLSKAGLDSIDTFDYSKALAQLNSQRYSKETYDAIKQILDKIFEKQNNLNDSVTSAQDTVLKVYQQLEEYQTTIADFEESLLKGMEEEAEKQIDKLDKINNTLTKAYKELIDEVKAKLDERRKQEDNQKTESELSQKQQRLSMLRADTSGGHAVEIAQLEKEIADAQQNYQRSLEDQLIEKLQQQGDKAEQQRQKQIDLLNIQKDIAKETGTNLAEVKALLKDPTSNKAGIKKAWLIAQGYDEATVETQKKLENDFEVAWAKYIAAWTQKNELMLDEELISTFKDIGKYDDAIYKKLDTGIINVKLTDAQKKQVGWTATDFTKEGKNFSQLRALGYTYKGSVQAIAATKGLSYVIDQLGASANALIKDGGYTLAQVQKAYNNSDTKKTNKNYMQNAQAVLTKNNKNVATGTLQSNNWAYARSGSTLYAQKWDADKAQWEKDAAQYSIGAISAQQISSFGNLGKQALLDAIQTTPFGNIINKNFASLVKATGLAGKEVNLANGWTGSIGSDGLIYQNHATGVKKWNPSTGKITEDLYNDKKKAAFLAVAKRNSETSREYAQVLMNNKVYTKAQLQAMGVKFKTGGLANFTGPAWLDGTPSKPELVLNATDTKNFIALKDVLSKAIGSTHAISNEYGGDTTFEININVDHIANDYDVDKMAERVKKIIVKDSSYRNVTQVRKFR